MHIYRCVKFTRSRKYSLQKLEKVFLPEIFVSETLVLFRVKLVSKEDCAQSLFNWELWALLFGADQTVLKDPVS